MQRPGRLLPFVVAAVLGYPGLVRAAPADVQAATELSTRTVRTEESGLADVVADALRAVDKSDMALVAASAFNEMAVPKGSVRPDGLVACLANPDDTVVVVRLTGAQVRKALERSFGLYPQKNIAFLQVSGLSATIDPAADKDKRVVSVKVGKADMIDTRVYNVAMPGPLANGALAYGTVWSRADIRRDTGTRLADALTDYVSATRIIGAKPEERLVVKH